MGEATQRLATRARAVATLARGLQEQAGLAEADRMGLRVCAEILEEALGALSRQPRLSSSQAGHLHQHGELLLGTADELPHEAEPAQIARWWRELEPAVREFARAVRDLPHR